MVMELTPELRKHFGAGEERGILVSRVEPLSPAALAGIKPGDVIVKVRGEPIDEMREVSSTLATPKRDQSIDVERVRDRAPMTVHAKLTKTSTWSLLDSPGGRWFRELVRPRMDANVRSAST